MEQDESRQVDTWAHEALMLVEGMKDRQRRNLLLHLFAEVAKHDHSGDDAIAGALCRSIHSTLELHRDEDYRKMLANSSRPTREAAVSIDDAIEALSGLHR